MLRLRSYFYSDGREQVRLDLQHSSIVTPGSHSGNALAAAAQMGSSNWVVPNWGLAISSHAPPTPYELSPTQISVDRFVHRYVQWIKSPSRRHQKRLCSWPWHHVASVWINVPSSWPTTQRWTRYPTAVVSNRKSIISNRSFTCIRQATTPKYSIPYATVLEATEWASKPTHGATAQSTLSPEIASQIDTICGMRFPRTFLNDGNECFITHDASHHSMQPKGPWSISGCPTGLIHLAVTPIGMEVRHAPPSQGGGQCSLMAKSVVALALCRLQAARNS